MDQLVLVLFSVIIGFTNGYDTSNAFIGRFGRRKIYDDVTGVTAIKNPLTKKCYLRFNQTINQKDKDIAKLINDFCKGYVITSPRIKRSAPHYFVGRRRGQTQSQYLNFGSNNEPGKAEAESTVDGSRAVVTGSSGMGQAQSQSGSSDCGDCRTQDQTLYHGRPFDAEIYTPGDIGSGGGGGYSIPPSSGQRPGNGGLPPGQGGNGGLPPGQSRNGRIPPGQGGNGGLHSGQRGNGGLPPGQGGNGGLPPGQGGNGGLPPGQGGNGGFPPGQGGNGRLPPGQGGNGGVPPGQSGNGRIPPGQGGNGGLPPGQGGNLGLPPSQGGNGRYPPSSPADNRLRPSDAGISEVSGSGPVRYPGTQIPGQGNGGGYLLNEPVTTPERTGNGAPGVRYPNIPSGAVNTGEQGNRPPDGYTRFPGTPPGQDRGVVQTPITGQYPTKITGQDVRFSPPGSIESNVATTNGRPPGSNLPPNQGPGTGPTTYYPPNAPGIPPPVQQIPTGPQTQFPGGSGQNVQRGRFSGQFAGNYVPDGSQGGRFAGNFAGQYEGGGQYGQYDSGAQLGNQYGFTQQGSSPTQYGPGPQGASQYGPASQAVGPSQGSTDQYGLVPVSPAQGVGSQYGAGPQGIITPGSQYGPTTQGVGNQYGPRPQGSGPIQNGGQYGLPGSGPTQGGGNQYGPGIGPGSSQYGPAPQTGVPSQSGTSQYGAGPQGVSGDTQYGPISPTQGGGNQYVPGPQGQGSGSQYVPGPQGTIQGQYPGPQSVYAQPNQGTASQAGQFGTGGRPGVGAEYSGQNVPVGSQSTGQGYGTGTGDLGYGSGSGAQYGNQGTGSQFGGGGGRDQYVQTTGSEGRPQFVPTAGNQFAGADRTGVGDQFGAGTPYGADRTSTQYGPNAVGPVQFPDQGIYTPSQQLSPSGQQTSQDQLYPGTAYAEDDSDSQAQSSVQQINNETHASANAQGTVGGGTAQSQVQGTYYGTGSFTASAGTSDGRRSAQTQIAGGDLGVMSSAQGTGGLGQSQTQVLLSGETGQTVSNAQSGGYNHGTNSQVQADEKGGQADAQANGPGNTSSQAQIGFNPFNENDTDDQGTPFRGGGTASAQGGAYSGQTQSQITGKFLFGIKYAGSAQAQSGGSTAPGNVTAFKPFVFPNITQLSHSSDRQNFSSRNLRKGSSSSTTTTLRYEVEVDGSTTELPEYTDDNYDTDDTDYNDEENHKIGTKSITQASGNQKQHIVLDPLEELDVNVHQARGNEDLRHGMVLQPGQSLPGSSGYRIPQGFRGKVISLSNGPNTAAFGPNSQAQSATIKPGSGRVVYSRPLYQLGSRTHLYNGNFGYGSGYTYQPVTYKLKSGKSLPNFVSLTKSETGSQDLYTGKRTPSVYYSQSSTCGYFTNTCVFNGKTKVCTPKPKTNPDGSPVIC